jgi:tRNA(fMet)-specific endonuclease VapC
MTVLRYVEDPRTARLQDRLKIAIETEDVATTVITVEEQMRGWLANIHAERNLHRQTIWYGKLVGLFTFFQSWRVELFDDIAVGAFTDLRTANSNRNSRSEDRCDRAGQRCIAPVSKCS